MSKTDFSEDNKGFSDKAHQCAREHVYPKLLGVDASLITYEEQGDLLTDKKWELLDGEFAIDRIVKIKVANLRYPLEITVQERFRKPEKQKFQDITITEFNPSSGERGELYKLKSQLFVYGYYDGDKNTMLDCIAVNIPSTLIALGNGSISHTIDSNPRTAQPFLGLTFSDLHKANVVEWHMKAPIMQIVAKDITKADVWNWIKQNKDDLPVIASLFVLIETLKNNLVTHWINDKAA